MLASGGALVVRRSTIGANTVIDGTERDARRAAAGHASAARQRSVSSTASRSPQQVAATCAGHSIATCGNGVAAEHDPQRPGRARQLLWRAGRSRAPVTTWPATRRATSPGPRTCSRRRSLAGPAGRQRRADADDGAARRQPRARSRQLRRCDDRSAGPGPHLRLPRSAQRDRRRRRRHRRVRAPGVPTPSVPLPANPANPTSASAAVRVPVAVCQHAVTLLDVVAISRGRVRVTGLARRAYTGRTVTIARGGRPSRPP